MAMHLEKNFSARRFLSAVFTAASLFIGAQLLSAQDQKPDNKTVPAPPTLVTPSDTTGIGSLCRTFKQSTLGRDMLGFAEQQGISIVYADADLRRKDQHAAYSDVNATVYLRRDMLEADQIIYLAHELRHAWQDKVLNYAEKNRAFLSPEQRWAFLRYIEADAFSFSAYFWACRIQEGVLMNTEGTTAAKTLEVAERLRKELDTADGLTLTEYLNTSLRQYLIALGEYDPAHATEVSLGNKYMAHRLSLLEMKKKSLGIEAIQEEVQVLAQKIEAAPPDSVFARYLRQFGSLSFDKNSGASALQDPSHTDRDILFTYVGSSKEDELFLLSVLNANKADSLIREKIRSLAVPQAKAPDFLQKKPGTYSN